MKQLQFRKPCGCVSAACIVHQNFDWQAMRKQYHEMGYAAEFVTKLDPTFRQECTHGHIEEQMATRHRRTA